MYTLTLSAQEARTIYAALESFQNNQRERLELLVGTEPRDLEKIGETGAHVQACFDLRRKIIDARAAAMNKGQS